MNSGQNQNHRYRADDKIASIINTGQNQNHRYRADDKSTTIYRPGPPWQP